MAAVCPPRPPPPPPPVITCSTGQSLPPTISSSSKKSCQTTVQGRFPSIQHSMFASRGTSATCWLLLKRFRPPSFASTQSGDSNKPLFQVKLAVVWRASYCGERDNVMLCETYSAYQRFFAVLTVAQWHLFFSPPYRSWVCDLEPLVSPTWSHSQCCLTHRL